jgi:uncharacterized protein YjbI with pentapeptide repeats
LESSNFSNAMLTGGSLEGAILDGALFIGTYILSAPLKDASLIAANLMGAKLVGTDLSGANLRGTNLANAYVNGADFSNATAEWTVFGSMDLSGAKGLEAVRHTGPSHIDIATLYKSKGDIPEVFLRGSGVPEPMITFAKSLVGKAFEFYRSFISYSSRDQVFATKLYADLRVRGVQVWFAQEDLKIGDRLDATIDDAIRLSEKLIIVLSNNSIESAWVRREAKRGLEKEELTGQNVLFPIRLDSAVMDTTEKWADDIRRNRHIGDFSNWTDKDEYQRALSRLLKDLNATPAE